MRTRLLSRRTVAVLLVCVRHCWALQPPTPVAPGTADSPGPVVETPVVTLRWQSVSGAAKYIVALRDLDTGALENSDVFVPATSLDALLIAGHQYRWNLTAVARSNESGVSQTLYFQAGGVPVRPVITGVCPSPVPAIDGKQVLVINGHSFRHGCSVTLREKSSNERFPDREILWRRNSQIILTPSFTKSQDRWTVEVVNPGGLSTGEFPFEAVAPQRIARKLWWRSGWPWTWAAAAAFGLSTAICFWAIFRRLPKRLEAMQHVLRREEHDRLIRDLHDRASADIAHLAQLADQTLQESLNLPVEVQRRFRDLSFAARDAETAIGDLTWAADPQNENLRQLAAKLRDRMRERLEPYGVERDFSGWPAPVPSVPVRAEAANQVLYLCHEVLNNVIKHAQATKLSSNLAITDGSLVLGFHDNGKGFQPDAARGDHRGLANMRTRVQKLGGSLEVISAPGTGTEITVRLPLAAASSTGRQTGKRLPPRGG